MIIAFSVNSPESADNVVAKWVPEIRHHTGGQGPYILVGLQTDMRDDIVVLKSLAKQGLAPLTTVAGQRMAKEVGAKGYMECSSFTGEGVQKALEKVRFVPRKSSRIRKPD